MKSLVKLSAMACAAAVTLGALWWAGKQPTAAPGPEVVVIPAGPYSYRPAGEFRSGNRMVDAPQESRVATRPLRIMKFHVTQDDYARCVAARACSATSGAASETASGAFAQVNVSYNDAAGYAQWLSAQTGQNWRLPTDEEWTRAAGDRFHEALLGPISNDPDPSKRWLTKYREEAARRGESDPGLREIGYYGANDLGVVDINGNIWEWTETCFKNGKVSPDGATLISSSDYCGVRAAQGKHRAFIVDFVRDAKSGGCAVGVPPDNLGFRLVVDDSSAP